jgi:hypothetical protein
VEDLHKLDVRGGPQMTTSQIQWHHEAHARWGAERLVFWQLGFFPVYRRDDVHKALDDFCEHYGIRGRTTYEVFGQHDLLARFWLPVRHEPDNANKDLNARLEALHINRCEMFVVAEIVAHWFWNDGTRKPASLDSVKAALDTKPGSQALQVISDLTEKFNAGEIDQAALTRNTLAQWCLSQEFLGIRDVRDGIMFAIVVSVEPGLDNTTVEALGEQLVLMLCEAEAIIEHSLYRETGSKRFLILGKVAPADFFAIDTQLIEPIVNKASLSTARHTRSVTYIGSSRRPTSFSEQLAMPASQDASQVETRAEVENAGRRKGSRGGFLTKWLGLEG